jgi:Nucleotidyltransferase of unknown function (DUF6036)
MNDRILAFLGRLDEALIPFAKEGEYFDMFHLGRSALIMHYGFALSTSDIDIVWMRDSDLERKAIELLGKGSALAQTLGLYLDPVPQGLPPLPCWFRKRAEAVPGNWKVLRLWKLEVHDLAATKLKSFRPRDRADLQALCEKDLLNAGKLRESLEAAFPWKSPKEADADDDPDTPDWGKALENCKRVEAFLNGQIRSI